VAESFHYHYLHLSLKGDLYLFIRTLSERPDLATNVSEVDIRRINTMSSTTHHGFVADPAVRNHLDHNFMHLNGSPAPQDSTGPTQHMALILQLLRLTPNLERLFLPLPGTGPSGISSQFSPETSLASLKTLAFGSFETEYLFDQAAPILRQAPNLEVLHCHLHARATELFSTSLGRKTPADEPPLQNLVEIALVDTSLTARSFRNLLRAVGPRLSKVNIMRTMKLPSAQGD
jgi:hypothetical protein